MNGSIWLGFKGPHVDARLTLWVYRIDIRDLRQTSHRSWPYGSDIDSVTPAWGLDVW
ncbi:hypothetical protein FRACA_80083 [Frankia canadensis]|uniref:Uncharacterized protein n=1 Tax=Frankia canadensis TaxID=1836972 RepID=A0A2I2L1I1_9ACTN|nr:hypothetical protein FRACA_80083 [Frankia canadensis]SOU59073.1 hypothetical protein FRACA_80083 [Frankia canadensis]